MAKIPRVSPVCRRLYSPELTYEIPLILTLIFLFGSVALSSAAEARESEEGLGAKASVAPELPSPELTRLWAPIPAVVLANPDNPPSDAVILFNGNDLTAWDSAKDPKRPAPWKVIDGAMVCVPESGNIRTKRSFGDIQLHLEFRISSSVQGEGQERGNSGVFFMGLYELQILDSYQNPTYVNGQAGAVYKQTPPLVNSSRPPGVWQTYDAVWIAPRFGPAGHLLSAARLTVFHNGVLVQHDVPVIGATVNRGFPAYTPHAAKLPLELQEHHNETSFRNIWVREIELPSGGG